MNLVPTDWYPDTILPVREGEYDVVEWPPHMHPSLDDPAILRADWSTKYGQTGFWLKQVSSGEGGAQTKSYRLLHILKWRGRQRIERMALTTEAPKVSRVQLVSD